MKTNSPCYTDEELRALGFAALGAHTQVARSCALYGIENIHLGDRVRIDAFTTITASECHAVRIEDFSHVGVHCYLSGSGGGIVLERYAILSSGVRLFSSADDYSGEFMTTPLVAPPYTNPRCGRVHLEPFSIVGAQAVVLPSCRLAEGAALGAFSLATKSLKAWTIYGGIPARRLKSRARKPLALSKRLEEDPRYRYLFALSLCVIFVESSLLSHLC